MKPPPRIRKTIKWGGAAVTVLLVVVWIGSGWFTVFFHSGSRYSASLLRGSVFVWHGESSQRWGVEFACSPAPHYDPWPTFYEGRYFGHRMPYGWHASAPLWICAAISSICSLAAWRLDTLARRRAKLNLCAKCGYDRTGILKDAKCPECGTTPTGH